MSNFISYKNIRLHYSDVGRGIAVVMLHGFLENLNMWHDLSKILKSNHRVICIDLLGHGQTDCLGYIHTMEDMADAVRAVVSHLKIKHYYLIGHSMGGYVALALAEQNGENIIGLCLANSTSRSDSKERKANRDRAIAAVKQNHKTFVRISISNLFRPKNRKLFSKELRQVKEEALKISVQGIVAALEGMKRRPDRSELLKNPSFKKMMIIGKKDPVLNYNALIEELRNTDVTIVELPDGHMSYIEDKKEFTYSIMHFIENI